jgi:hypothetical protein
MKKQQLREKYRALLEGCKGDEKEQEDMEITFTPGLVESTEQLLEKKKEDNEVFTATQHVKYVTSGSQMQLCLRG